MRWLFLSLILVTLVGSARAQPMPYEADICTQRRAEAPLLSIADCLGSPEPDIRDGFAYTEIMKRLRDGDVPEQDVRTLSERLIASLEEPDPSGFQSAFALLVMSEIARVDRITPYLSEQERDTMIDKATKEFRSVKEYRGFIDEEGWRHGIAHGADWLLQLVLHQELSKDQALKILDAVSTQVGISNHAYIHGEPARIARPVLFIAQHGVLSQEDWDDWFAALAAPFPMTDWSEAFKSEAGLARRHNLKAFLNSLYIAGDISGSQAFESMRGGLGQAQRLIP